MQHDLKFDLGEFAATSATLTALTPAGEKFLAEQFGPSVNGTLVSLTIRKSQAAEVAAAAFGAGLKFS